MYSRSSEGCSTPDKKYSRQNLSQKNTDTIWADKDLKDELTKLAIQEYGQDIMTDDSPGEPEINQVNDDTNLPPIPTEDDVTTQPFSEDDIPF